jgi:hypothetical protein
MVCLMVAALAGVACGPGTPEVQNPTTNPDGTPYVEPISGPVTKVTLKGASPTADWVEDITATADGKSLHIITRDGALWRWTPTEGVAERVVVIGEEREKTSMRPGGLLALAIGGDAPRVFDAGASKELMRFASWKGTREAVWSPSGGHFILVNQDGTLAMWDVKEQLTGFKEGEKLEDFLNRQEPKHQIEMDSKIRHVALTADGRMAVAVDDGSKKGTLYVGDIAKLDQLTFLGRTNVDIANISLSPDAQYLAVANQDQTLRVVSTSKQGFLPWIPDIKTSRVAWTPRNDLAVIDDKGQVKVFDRGDGRALWTAVGPFSQCVPAKNWFACTDGRSIQLFNPENGRDYVRLATWGELYLIYTSSGHYAGTAKAADWLSADGVKAEQWGLLKDQEKVKVQTAY